jgi:hypothetical protein
MNTNQRQITSRNVQTESLSVNRDRMLAASEASTSPADCVCKAEQILAKTRSQRRRSMRSMHFTNRRSARSETSFFSPIHDLLPNAVPIEIPALETSARLDLICKDSNSAPLRQLREILKYLPPCELLVTQIE